MINKIKEMAMEKGKALLQSKAVSKILESEKMGTVIEKAMTVPFKISNIVAGKREKLAAMLDLATQEDMDEIRRAVSRMEDTLNTMKDPNRKTETQ